MPIYVQYLFGQIGRVLCYSNILKNVRIAIQWVGIGKLVFVWERGGVRKFGRGQIWRNIHTFCCI